jgi:hypothetical protein
MAPIMRKMRRVLREKFPPPDKIKLHNGETIYGLVISPQFAGKDFEDRYDMIWDHVNQRMTRDERKKLTVLFALTPEEQATRAKMHSHA